MLENLKEKLDEQIYITRKALAPDTEMYIGLFEFTNLVEIFFQYLEEKYAQKNHEKSSKSVGKGRKALCNRSKTCQGKKENARKNGIKRSKVSS